MSSIFMLVVFVLYFRQVIQGSSTPNPAAWTIWLITSVMNTVTFYYVAGGTKFLLTAVTASCVFMVFLYTLSKRKFTKPGKVVLTCFLLAILVGIFWNTTEDPILTNLLLQGILAIAFWPTINGLLKKIAREKALPWGLATIAYSLLILAIVFDWENSNCVALVHPIIGICGNGSVAFLVCNQKSR